MPARKRTPVLEGTVTVTVVEPHLVFHDGEQRGGTLEGVDRALADHWHRHGYATIADDPPPATVEKVSTVKTSTT